MGDCIHIDALCRTGEFEVGREDLRVCVCRFERGEMHVNGEGKKKKLKGKFNEWMKKENEEAQ